ncbi:hypothetical protein QR680_006299 [Steinernema hermaphroditum]|uniref:Uncharacterized protein n=1 Tax=Steinernema hermaphroditum TaxID=289476 RepID=A0AA39HWG0_9BILA|nr:hypothetical protein QR680_006299 [Steinernema hermaphroditum]
MLPKIRFLLVFVFSVGLVSSQRPEEGWEEAALQNDSATENITSAGFIFRFTPKTVTLDPADTTVSTPNIPIPSLLNIQH